ncbi:MAG: hypothetical protein E7384_03905 [Ruminococcaceae bacterium]|nr:hypothetical protein [Oscillospiraceae bacterium]
MGLFKFFHTTKTYEEDIQREKDCVTRIKQAVSQRCGIDNFIDYDEFTVAFSGSKDNMELMLEICTQKCEGKKYLYASVDDDVSWQEWDFDNTEEFENSIIEFIANRVNRTIKTVTEVNNKSFRVASYYLDENNEWVCFEDESSYSKLFCYITAHLTKTSEIIKTYKLETGTDIESEINQSSWDDKYKKLDLNDGKLQSFCDDDEDMLLITYEDGMQIDVGYIKAEESYYITVVQDETIESWNNPLGVVVITDKSKIPEELQKAIYKYRNM